MKLKLIMAGILVFAASIAFAGSVVPAVGVVVDLDNRVAFGNMRFARISDNDVEFIGCGIRVFDDGVNPFSFGFCAAADSESVGEVCLTESANLIDTIKGTSDFSFLTFSWDENDECTRIGFSTQSFYLPDSVTRDDPHFLDDDDDD